MLFRHPARVWCGMARCGAGAVRAWVQRECGAGAAWCGCGCGVVRGASAARVRRGVAWCWYGGVRGSGCEGGAARTLSPLLRMCACVGACVCTCVRQCLHVRMRVRVDMGQWAQEQSP